MVLACERGWGVGGVFCSCTKDSVGLWIIRVELWLEVPQPEDGGMAWSFMFAQKANFSREN